jgi:hypothetical protein
MLLGVGVTDWLTEFDFSDPQRTHNAIAPAAKTATKSTPTRTGFSGFLGSDRERRPEAPRYTSAGASIVGAGVGRRRVAWGSNGADNNAPSAKQKVIVSSA